MRVRMRVTGSALIVEKGGDGAAGKGGIVRGDEGREKTMKGMRSSVNVRKDEGDGTGMINLSLIMGDEIRHVECEGDVMKGSFNDLLRDGRRDVAQYNRLFLADFSLPIPRQIRNVEEKRIERMEGEEGLKGTKEGIGRGEGFAVTVFPEPNFDLPVAFQGLEDEGSVISVSRHQDQDGRRRPTPNDCLCDIRGNLGIDSLLAIEFVSARRRLYRQALVGEMFPHALSLGGQRLCLRAVNSRVRDNPLHSLQPRSRRRRRGRR